MMKMMEIKEIARELGLKPGKLKKTDLIKKVQEAEGNFPCFGSTTDDYCDQMECAFRVDCLGHA